MGFLSLAWRMAGSERMSDRRALRGAKCMPDIRQGMAVQASEGCQRCARREEDKQERAEPLTASAARDPVPEPPYVVGVVNLLALAVTLHANGPELAVSIDMFGIYSNVQARTSLSGTLPEKACDSLQAVSGYTL